MTLRVAIYDDNRSRRDSLQLLINATEEFDFAGAYHDCSNVIENTVKQEPDVILMDIDMPNVDGIEGVYKVKSQFPEVKVLMQTVFEDNSKIFEAICAGANGYLLKQASPEELLAAIKDVFNDGAPMTPSIANKVLGLLQGSLKQNKPKDFSLTGREQEVLSLLVEGYSYKMIADKCHISYATVNSHVTKIYSKLQVKSVASAVSLAVREGLV